MIELNRREFLILSSLAVVGAALGVRPAYAQQLELYFLQTGHHLSGDFLNFWRRNRNGHIFGLPITEEMEDQEGWKIQYFENVRLEQDPDDGHIQLGALGMELFQREKIPMIDATIPYPFYIFTGKYPIDFGLAIEGLSPDREGDVLRTQRVALLRKNRDDIMPERIIEWMYTRNLQNLRVLWPGEVTLLPLGKIIAEYDDIDVSGVPQREGSLNFRPNMFDRQKQIDVDLTEQILTAYEGDVQVLLSPVSTGKPGYETPVGNFRITWKPEYLDYWSPFKEVRYFQPHVPFNLMFEPLNYIHGAYWHDEFATTKSHGRSYGCVNLDMDEAKWLYDWTPYGAPVRIHY